MTPAIQAGDLCVRRDGRDVLSKVSLSVATGEAVAVAGPNGGGKTTLLLCLAGLLTPDAGTATLAGRVGYLPQRTPATGALPVTPAQMLRLAAGAPGQRDDAWLDRLIEVVLADVEVDRPVGRMSGGQQQLVAIAKAMAYRPAVLLLDEPTLGLSPDAVTRLVAAVRLARAELDAAVVVATHDHLAAMRLADRLVYLDRSIRYDGPADTVPTHLDAHLCHHE